MFSILRLLNLSFQHLNGVQLRLQQRSRIGSAFIVITIVSFLVSCAPVHPATSPAARPPHDPTKFESEILAFEKHDRLSAPPDQPILFVGSSTIRFWKVADAFGDLPVLNRGFGGSQVQDVNYYFDRVVLPYRPSTIVFYSGDNDLADGLSPAEVAADVQRFIARVQQKLPGTRLILIGIKPSIARWKLIAQMRQTNRQLESFTKATPGGVYVDVEPEILGPNGKPRPELFRPDGLHLNAQGYEILNAKLSPLIHSEKKN